MPLSPEEKRKLLVESGYNETDYDVEERPDGLFINERPKASPTSTVGFQSFSSVQPPQLQGESSAWGAAGRSAGANILPTGVGLAAGVAGAKGGAVLGAPLGPIGVAGGAV